MKGDVKRYNRLKKREAQGKKSSFLDEEQILNVYEENIVFAANNCLSINDIISFAKISFILDVECFLRLVLFAKRKKEEFERVQ